MENLKKYYREVWFERLSCDDEFYCMVLDELLKFLIILMNKEVYK